MEQIAFVTGADRGLGQALTVGLLERGWRVFAGQYIADWPQLDELAVRFPQSLHIVPLDVSSIESVRAAAQSVSEMVDHVDLLISNAGIGGGRAEFREGLDYEAMHRTYNVNSLGAVRLVESFLPLTDRGSMKRLCFVSSEVGSIALSVRQGAFGYCMSKTALNMAVRIMFNHLYPEGYTFRLYQPGWMRSYMGGEKGTMGDMEPEESAAQALPLFLNDRDDEGRLAMIDYLGAEWPF
ncbi:MAG: hypothetical protein A2Y73_03285 [Chloroflexi bacterium RBG_13_56_8]|nr:MAG: hypothetical protein A2Y73_03285 [Chloroflexi bacterium RBG_13_56_8]